jgi:NADH-quinone oxidoreductase subunit C
VVYEPVALAQDYRNFDFMSPWEGAQYILPGDEKAQPEAPGAPTPLKADEIGKGESKPAPPPPSPKTTDTTAQTGAGEAGNKALAKPSRPRKPVGRTPKAGK